ncbi:hypothetical protein OG292_27620 [Streptomyces sp. NBC_01511]|uniref:hypothetical protein n=1 Tax=Streptomyces sp. NBC_01511 TaxID=2903889 RepID=UPI0038679FC9
MDDAAWDAAVMGVVDRLSPALVVETHRGSLSLDTAVQILDQTTCGALTGTQGFLEGCLSDLMGYDLDGTTSGEVEGAEESRSRATAEEQSAFERETAETQSELAWALIDMTNAGRLSLETAVLLYAMTAEIEKAKAEEVISFVMVESMTPELEYGG